MSRLDHYLYSNKNAVARERLRTLEQLEDPSTVDLLTRLGVTTGWNCLEIGAGAGSIAEWLASRVGSNGRVVATDVETDLLDPDKYEVWNHDLRTDELPDAAFDLIHFRHVLIHIRMRKHPSVLTRMRRTLKPGGALLAEESDMHSWRVQVRTPESIRRIFTSGVHAVLSAYRSRGMDTGLGGRLSGLVADAGFELTDVAYHRRHVTGNSSEANFHELSVRQLATAVKSEDAESAARLERFADCFKDEELEYETRTTVAVSAVVG